MMVTVAYMSTGLTLPMDGPKIRQSQREAEKWNRKIGIIGKITLPIWIRHSLTTLFTPPGGPRVTMQAVAYALSPKFDNDVFPTLWTSPSSLLHPPLGSEPSQVYKGRMNMGSGKL